MSTWRWNHTAVSILGYRTNSLPILGTATFDPGASLREYDITFHDRDHAGLHVRLVPACTFLLPSPPDVNS